MGLLLNESFTAVAGDVTKPDAELVQELAEADVIIDASASVAVSRHLADLENSQRTAHLLYSSIRPGQPWCSSPRATTARSRCGTLRRSITALFRPIRLSRIICAPAPGLRYSGSCRALTNRIPATSAALLSALGRARLVDALKSDEPAVRVWKLTAQGGVEVIERHGAPHASRVPRRMDDHLRRRSSCRTCAASRQPAAA